MFSLYQNIFHTGSYYDGLRVSDANEFDLNMALDLSVLKKHIQFETKKVPGGYVRLRLDQDLTTLVPRGHRFEPAAVRMNEKLFSNDGKAGKVLDVAKVKKWIEGIVAKVVVEVNNSGSLRKWGITKVRTDLGVCLKQ